MDTFIDKLAQRLTAQEMIKANSAADAEELHKVQGQVKQYEAYLDEMQNISSATVAAVNRLEHASEASTEMVDRLEHASVASASVIERLEGTIESALQAIGRMEQMQEMSAQLADRLEHAGVASAAASERIDQAVNDGVERLEHAGVAAAAASEQIDRVVNVGIAKLQHAEVNTDGINELVAASVGKIKEMQEGGGNIQTMLRDSVNGQNETISDFVHKENVKVYRNVQAVVVEETAKQTERLEKVNKSSSTKMGAILGISLVALLASLGSLIFQILTYLHVI